MITAALLLAASLSAAPRVTTYAVPQKRIPTEIVRHGDELWFIAWQILPHVESRAFNLRAYFGRVTTRGRVKLVETAPAEHMPGLATHTPDGTLWFTDARNAALWRISKTGRVERVPARWSASIYIAYADGDLWCSHAWSAWISRTGTDGTYKDGFTIPDDVPPPMTSSQPPPPGPRASSLVAGPDGALWFPEPHRNRIGRMTTSGEFTFFKLEPRLGSISEIMVGPDGALWFTTAEPLLGRITTAGEISTVKTGFAPIRITSDSQGRIWYVALQQAGIVGGEEFIVEGAQQIRSIVEGPDGAMWFADGQANRIGKIELAPAASRPR